MRAVAEFERVILRERQAEEIKLAKAKGVYLGRKALFGPEKIANMKQKIEDGIPKARIAWEMGACSDTHIIICVKI